MLAAGIDWTTVLVALIAAVPALAAAILANHNRRALKPPSGGRLGEVVEQTAHMASANHALATQIHSTTRDTNKVVHKIEENGGNG